MKKLPFIFLLCAGIALLQGFAGSESNDNTVSKRDVQLRIPKNFPEPYYTFRDNKPTPAGFHLGRKLFYDPILSQDNSVSCASCHQQPMAFANSAHTRSLGIRGLIGKRNAPPIQNMIWQKHFMWDGGVLHLELQPMAPMTAADEMADTMEHVLSRLRKSPDYPALFKAAFGDTAISSVRLLKAMAQFTGLLISASSRYDRVIAGKSKFTTQEQHGFNLFNAHCSTCHPPPLFTDNTFRNIGLPFVDALQDSGRAHITHIWHDYMKFKVPSLRNIGVTQPYMHDGRFRTLAEVIEHYRRPPGNRAPTDDEMRFGIELNKSEQAALIAFLHTLTDSTFLNDRRFVP